METSRTKCVDHTSRHWILGGHSNCEFGVAGASVFWRSLNIGQYGATGRQTSRQVLVVGRFCVGARGCGGRNSFGPTSLGFLGGHLFAKYSHASPSLVHDQGTKRIRGRCVAAVWIVPDLPSILLHWSDLVGSLVAQQVHLQEKGAARREIIKVILRFYQ